MADNEEDWRNDPNVQEKYTWHKDDVVWEKTSTGSNTPVKGLETKEKRRRAWKALNPDTPYPPTLQEDNDESDNTTDKSVRPRPKVQVHVHRTKR